jgi:hypothetical protein
VDEKSAHGARDLTHKRIEVELYNEGHTAEAGLSPDMGNMGDRTWGPKFTIQPI